MNALLQAVELPNTNVNMKSRDRIPNAAMKAIREALGLSQEEFGRPAGFKQPTIARLETGEIRTSSTHAVRLAEAHGRNARDFFPTTQGFSPADDAELASRASVIARRLAADDERLFSLVAGLAYVVLDLERRNLRISDEETLSLIESMIRRFQTGR